MLNNLDATMQSIKSIINDLRPFELDLGLLAALKWQIKAFERISRIPCELSFDAATFDHALGEKQILAIFRVLQESLCNIARHSRATKVEVTLSRNERAFSMRIKDNGIGIDPASRRKANSFGILGIQERVNSLGGELIIDSACGNGTALSIFIPVDAGQVELKIA